MQEETEVCKLYESKLIVNSAKKKGLIVKPINFNGFAGIWQNKNQWISCSLSQGIIPTITHQRIKNRSYLKLRANLRFHAF